MFTWIIGTQAFAVAGIKNMWSINFHDLGHETTTNFHNCATQDSCIFSPKITGAAHCQNAEQNGLPKSYRWQLMF